MHFVTFVQDPPDWKLFHPFVNAIFFFQNKFNITYRTNQSEAFHSVFTSNIHRSNWKSTKNSLHRADFPPTDIFIAIFALAVVQSAFIAFALQCNLHAYHFSKFSSSFFIIPVYFCRCQFLRPEFFMLQRNNWIINFPSHCWHPSSIDITSLILGTQLNAMLRSLNWDLCRRSFSTIKYSTIHCFWPLRNGESKFSPRSLFFVKCK